MRNNAYEVLKQYWKFVIPYAFDVLFFLVGVRDHMKRSISPKILLIYII